MTSSVVRILVRGPMVQGPPRARVRKGPPLHTGGGIWGGSADPSPENFSIFFLMHSGRPKVNEPATEGLAPDVHARCL